MLCKEAKSRLQPSCPPSCLHLQALPSGQALLQVSSELAQVSKRGSRLVRSPEPSGCWGSTGHTGVCTHNTAGAREVPMAAVSLSPPMVIPGQGTCSESKFDRGKFQPRKQRFCGGAQARRPHPRCVQTTGAGQRCCAQTFWPPSRAYRSPRDPKICFSGSNTWVSGSPLDRHIDSGISIQSDRT